MNTRNLSLLPLIGILFTGAMAATSAKAADAVITDKALGQIVIHEQMAELERNADGVFSSTIVSYLRIDGSLLMREQTTASCGELGGHIGGYDDEGNRTYQQKWLRNGTNNVDTMARWICAFGLVNERKQARQQPAVQRQLF